MASEVNGWVWKVITAIMIPAFILLTNHVIANDKDSRSRDKWTEDKLVLICEKQQMVNQEILVALKGIQTDMKYIKRVN